MKKRIGAHGEEIVEKDLKKKGYRIIGRNIHTREGEIDIAALKKGNLYIIEVKTTRYEYGGAENMTAIKFQKLQWATYELQQKEQLPKKRVQFDLAVVRLDKKDEKIEYFKNLGPFDFS